MLNFWLCFFFNNFHFQTTFLDTESVFYYKIGLILLFPAFFGGALLIFWLLAIKIYNLSLNEAFTNFLQSEIIIIAYFLSSIINSLADFVNCTTINQEDFNVSYLLVQCTHNDYYSFWRNYFILPSFILYSIILPFVAFVYMYKHRMELFEFDVMTKISFLLNGYKRESFYW